MNQQSNLNSENLTSSNTVSLKIKVTQLNQGNIHAFYKLLKS